jgi:DNA mismatch repair protein MutS
MQAEFLRFVMVRNDPAFFMRKYSTRTPNICGGASTMTFQSILFETAENKVTSETGEQPDCFKDLNLDQIVASIIFGKSEYHLEPFFYTSLSDTRTIEYRHEVMKELENDSVFGAVKEFADGLQGMRSSLAAIKKLHYIYQKEWWLLEAVRRYCETVTTLDQKLSSAELKSRGMIAFREFLNDYVHSEPFNVLLGEIQKLFGDLDSIEYCMLIKGLTIQVRKYDNETDYSVEVMQTFEKFKQKAAKSYLTKFGNTLDMNHVEVGVLDLVAKLYPEIFAELDDFNTKNADYLNPTVAAFDREIQFYVSYLEFIASFQRRGLSFCYPLVTDDSKEIYDYDEFDLAMASHRLRSENSEPLVVCNDFYLKGPERIIVVSGPNQGGKTTFARTYGQLHFLASLGCPVPGREAKLFLFDRIYTHFEREEDIKNLRGKLQDDLVRIHEILSHATTNSLIIANEIFSSTTLQDAVLLGKKVIEKIIQLDSLCICVTFLDELSTLGEKTDSMVSTVVPEHPDQRTFKVIRKPADGLSYAKTIAEKYGLTYENIKERIKV